MKAYKVTISNAIIQTHIVIAENIKEAVNIFHQGYGSAEIQKIEIVTKDMCLGNTIALYEGYKNREELDE
jgi:hypothetical protein